MAALIGDGSHYCDIIHAIPDEGPVLQFRHHSDWDGLDDEIIIAINDPRLRASIAEELGIKDLAWVHPNTIIGPVCEWDYGTHINYAVSMTRTTIGHHTTISPGVTICGDVHIGDRVLIGAGATICDRVTIHDDVTIGAGAVILPETIIPAGETWFGVPGRPR